MKQSSFNMIKIEAETGKVFDWKNLDEHTTVNESGETVVEHLRAKVVFLAANDSVENYVEVDE